jgi:hypothetical protein
MAALLDAWFEEREDIQGNFSEGAEPAIWMFSSEDNSPVEEFDFCFQLSKKDSDSPHLLQTRADLSRGDVDPNFTHLSSLLAGTHFLAVFRLTKEWTREFPGGVEVCVSYWPIVPIVKIDIADVAEFLVKQVDTAKGEPVLRLGGLHFFPNEEDFESTETGGALNLTGELWESEEFTQLLVKGEPSTCLSSIASAYGLIRTALIQVGFESHQADSSRPIEWLEPWDEEAEEPKWKAPR